MTPGKLSPTVT